MCNWLENRMLQGLKAEIVDVIDSSAVHIGFPSHSSSEHPLLPLQQIKIAKPKDLNDYVV